MNKFIVLVVILFLQLALNSLFACESETKSSFSSNESISNEIVKSKISSQSKDADENKKTDSNHCNHCIICHHFLLFTTSVSFNLDIPIVDSITNIHPYIYKQPFIRFDQKPPIKA